jgi:hypothetical protein
MLSISALLALWNAVPAHAQESIPALPDSTTQVPNPSYDPFGSENSPDHTGEGSGGVLTPSPYEDIIQTYYTRMNADYYGMQFMLDSPLQISMGAGWSAYQSNAFGLLAKARTTGFRQWKYDPLRNEQTPYYLLALEGSFERPFKEGSFRAFKIRINAITESKGLSMPGVGAIISRGNVLIAADHSLDRRLEVEIMWMQVGAGYVMPLSPMAGGVNLAVCGAVDLLGLKYQSSYAGRGEFEGVKIGSVGWLLGVGWNVGRILNLAGYMGAEWGYSTGGLRLPKGIYVFSDLSRSTLFFGCQATGRWFNIAGGVQKEWENLDYQSQQDGKKVLRYYLGANVYFRR